MGRILFCGWVFFAAALGGGQALAQGYPPGGPGGPGGMRGAGAQQSEIPNTPIEEKPDKAAAKAYAAGLKTMNKAHEQEAILLKETDPEKRGRAREKLEDLLRPRHRTIHPSCYAIKIIPMPGIRSVTCTCSWAPIAKRWTIATMP